MNGGKSSGLFALCFRLFEVLAALSFITAIWSHDAPEWAHDLLKAASDPGFIAGAVTGVAITLTAVASLLWNS
jgi:hypothetical protein